MGHLSIQAFGEGCAGAEALMLRVDLRVQQESDSGNLDSQCDAGNNHTEPGLSTYPPIEGDARRSLLAFPIALTSAIMTVKPPSVMTRWYKCKKSFP